MKRNNWPLGILVSIIIPVIISLPRVMRADSIVSWGNFLSSFIYLLPFCFLCWIAHTWIRHNEKLKFKIQNRLMFAFIAIISVAVLSVFYDRVYAILYDDLFSANGLYRVRKPVILSVRSVVISSLYYFIIFYLNLASEKQKAALEIERLKQAQLQAKLLSLKEQLSPHFLFNTLNTLASISSEPEVKRYVYELANVYRYMLQYKESDMATLQNELSFIDSYLYIIKTRMEEAIQINVRVDNNLLSSKIPPLTLQILIENAIKHNIAAPNKPLEIWICNEANDWLVVQNKLLPKSSVLHTTGIGLDNVMQRYHLLFGKKILIEKKPELFSVKLPIVL